LRYDRRECGRARPSSDRRLRTDGRVRHEREIDMISLTVNGTAASVDADPATPLLWVLREALGLTGVKFGCGAGACGACAVHVNGETARACTLPLDSVAGASVVTIEGLAASAGLPAGTLHPVQRAWIDVQVPQCGYCQSGMIMAAAALLKAKPAPTDAEIAAAITNLCRCGTYPRVRRAIHALAREA
jgi:isoquinoline 1-oxidoreductase alpha subunit